MDLSGVLDETEYKEQWLVLSLCEYQSVTHEALAALIKKTAPKSSTLDVLPTALLKQPAILDVVLPNITYIINSSLMSGRVPTSFKLALVSLLLKKRSGLDVNNFKNFMLVSNLSFLSKPLEKAAACQI